jgi:hypothetical protein
MKNICINWTIRISTVRGHEDKTQIIEHHNEKLVLEVYVHDHLRAKIQQKNFEFFI